MSLSESIKQFRKERDLTQQQAAAVIGIPRANLAAIEEGRSHSKLDTLKKIIDACEPEDIKQFLFGCSSQNINTSCQQ